MLQMSRKPRGKKTTTETEPVMRQAFDESWSGLVSNVMVNKSLVAALLHYFYPQNVVSIFSAKFILNLA